MRSCLAHLRPHWVAAVLLATSVSVPCIVAADHTDSLRAVTWNVHGCSAGVDGVVRELRQLDAAVICLQEAETPPRESGKTGQAEFIASKLGMQQFSAGSKLPNGNEQCMAILSRSAITRGERLDAGTGRIYGVTALVSCEGRAIRVVCVHLTSSYRADVRHAARTSAARVKEAKDLTDRLAKWTEPVVLAGDFNSVPGLPEHTLVEQRLARSSTTQPTCPSDGPLLSLDHIYHSRALTLRGSRVVKTSASDHLPVVAEFAWAGPASAPAPATRGSDHE